MGKKDRAEKLLTNDNEVFAELFNKLVFSDERIIDPDHLRQRDPFSILNILNDEHRQLFPERTGDVLKHALIRYDDRFTCLLLGIENQSKVDYAMPLRVLLYDAISYTGQLEEERISEGKGMAISQKR